MIQFNWLTAGKHLDLLAYGIIGLQIKDACWVKSARVNVIIGRYMLQNSKLQKGHLDKQIISDIISLFFKNFEFKFFHIKIILHGDSLYIIQMQSLTNYGTI